MTIEGSGDGEKRMEKASRNDLAYVRRTVAQLASWGVHTWVFGGWAEELSSEAFRHRRAHGDLDLLYPSGDFGLVDALIRRVGLHEIDGKHLPHKRAVILEGVMVELFLLQQDEAGLYTDFWGENKFRWPTDVVADYSQLLLASPASLSAYRAAHDLLQRDG